MLIKSAL